MCASSGCTAKTVCSKSLTNVRQLRGSPCAIPVGWSPAYASFVETFTFGFNITNRKPRKSMSTGVKMSLHREVCQREQIDAVAFFQRLDVSVTCAYA